MFPSVGILGAVPTVSGQEVLIHNGALSKDVPLAHDFSKYSRIVVEFGYSGCRGTFVLYAGQLGSSLIPYGPTTFGDDGDMKYIYALNFDISLTQFIARENGYHRTSLIGSWTERFEYTVKIIGIL